MSVVALLLVAAAAAFWHYWSASQKIQGNMFQNHDSTAIEQIHQQETAKQPATLGSNADWVDENGNQYYYRHDLVTVLLIGVDYMGDKSNWDKGTDFNGGNADVLALAVLDPKTNGLTLVYIPRDTMADVVMLDDKGNFRENIHTNISAAHSYGDGGAISCELTEDAVSNLLYGIPIKRYVALDYDGISTINELLGGVQITFDKDYTNLDKAFTAGSTLVLSDQQMKTFITSRDESELNSAYNRGERQMLLIRAIFNQCKTSFQKDITLPVKFYMGSQDYVTTDLSTTEMTYLARQFFAAKLGANSVVTLQGTMTHGKKYAEYDLDKDWLHDFVVRTFCTTSPN